MKLSEQQLVDCSQAYGNLGCKGGWDTQNFEYAKTNLMMLESEYPYKGKDQKCNYNKSQGKLMVTKNTVVPPKSVAQIKAALTVQPTGVSVDINS